MGKKTVPPSDGCNNQLFCILTRFHVYEKFIHTWLNFVVNF